MSESTLGGLVAIAFAADDAYAPGLIVSLTSLLAHLDESRPVDVIVLDEGLSRRVIAELRRIVSRFPVARRLKILPGFNSTGMSARVDAYLSTAMYGRLLLPTAGLDADRLIFVDSDTVTVADASELLDRPSESAPLAAVVDADALTFFGRLRWGPLPGEFDPEAPYINSGVLVMRLGQWQERRLAEQALSLITAPDSQLRFHDQDAINLCLAGEIELLPDRWNYQLRFERQREVPRQLRTATIIHFNDAVKPWSSFAWLSQGPLARRANLTWWRWAMLGRGPSAQFRLSLFLRAGLRLLLLTIRAAQKNAVRLEARSKGRLGGRAEDA